MVDSDSWGELLAGGRAQQSAPSAPASHAGDLCRLGSSRARGAQGLPLPALPVTVSSQGALLEFQDNKGPHPTLPGT